MSPPPVARLGLLALAALLASLIYFCSPAWGRGCVIIRRYKEAEFHFKRALQLREKELGPGHIDVATDRHQLAMLVHSMQRPEEALVLAEDALKARRPTYMNKT